MQFHAKYPLFDSQSERDFTFLAMRFHAKYPLFDSQSDREFTFSYAILRKIQDKNLRQKWKRDLGKFGCFLLLVVFWLC